MKKIMFLGAGAMQVPPISYAKSQNYYVITCDNRPDNPGHVYADKTFNVSIVEKEEVLRIARAENIDGIVSYASDVGAPTVAYVGNELGLVSNPYDSVKTLTDKSLFRTFLSKEGFCSPKAYASSSLKDITDAYLSIGGECIVKPVDSSGSKGVVRVSSIDEIDNAFKEAQKYSLSGKIIIEQFFDRKGYQVAGDGFLVDGKLRFRCWANEHFEKLCNGIVPVGESFPAVLEEKQQEKAHTIVQKIFSLLDMQYGAINFDFMVSGNDDIYVLELGPRNGGNLIPEVIKYSTGVDLVAMTVEQALGHNVDDLTQCKPEGYYASYILHCWEKGTFKCIEFDEKLTGKIIKCDINVDEGDKVDEFYNASFGIGSMILRFDTEEEMLTMMDNMETHITVKYI